MFDVCLLGTGGMLPLPNRYLTSCWIRFGGHSILIDCGEGTQMTMRRTGWSFKDVDYILFTHYHADHISGLPGLLLSIGNCDRTEPVVLIGPKGLKHVVDGLMTIAPGLPFPVECRELTQEQLQGEEMEMGGMIVKCAKANHGVPCVGYSVEVRRRPRFDREKAEAAGVPLFFWSKLQNGMTMTDENGKVYTPDMVLAEERKGLKVTYSTDSRPTSTICELAKGSDLFICEGMYGEPDKQMKAKEHKHMAYVEAAHMAKEASVEELWLTHFSPAMPNPADYLDVAASVFPNVKVGKDRMTKEFNYQDE